jgi:hypothetical protein
MATVTETAQKPVPRVGDFCPTGTYKSGHYCKRFNSSEREALPREKRGGAAIGLRRLTSQYKHSTPSKPSASCGLGLGRLLLQCPILISAFDHVKPDILDLRRRHVSRPANHAALFQNPVMDDFLPKLRIVERR